MRLEHHLVGGYVRYIMYLTKCSSQNHIYIVATLKILLQGASENLTQTLHKFVQNDIQ